MPITLPTDAEKRVRQKVKSGAFASADEVVRAALEALDQQQKFGDFAPSELEALLAEGEESISEDGTLDGDTAFRSRKRRRKTRSAK